MSWLRLDEDVLSDKGVVRARAEHGPLGVAAWMFVLTKAKRDNKGGLVEVAPIVMATEVGCTEQQAADVVSTLATTAGLMQMQAKQDMYVVPNWPHYQPDSRAPGRERTTGTSSVSQGQTGQRDVTGRDEGKTPSAPGRGSRRGGAQAQRRAASEIRQAVMRGEL